MLPKEAKQQQLQELSLVGVLASCLGGISSLCLLPWTELLFFSCHPTIRSNRASPGQAGIPVSFSFYLHYQQLWLLAFFHVLVQRTQLLRASGRG